MDCGPILADLATRLSMLLEQGEPVALEPLRKQLSAYRTYPVATQLPSGHTRSPEAIYAQSCDSVVIIGKLYKCDKCGGWHVSHATGFALHKEGIICTNYHVLAEDAKFEAVGVLCRNGRLLRIEELLAASQADDLLVVRVNARDLVPLPVAARAAVGARVLCLSHPAGHLFALTEGIVAGYFQHPTRVDMAITADFAQGSSGAPVLDTTGAVVGIARATAPAYASGLEQASRYPQMVWKYCTPSARLLALLH